MRTGKYIAAFFFLILIACKPAPDREAVEDARAGLAAAAEQVKVLASAGSNDLIMWDTLPGGIFIARNTLDFLPLPGNMAVLEAPSIHQKSTRTYLPVMILSKPLKVGEELDVRIIGCFEAERNDRLEQTLIAVPVDDSKKSIQVEYFVDFITKYDPVRNILQDWLLYYRPSQNIRMIGWKDEQYAGYLIANLKYGDRQHH